MGTWCCRTPARPRSSPGPRGCRRRVAARCVPDSARPRSAAEDQASAPTRSSKARARHEATVTATGRAAETAVTGRQDGRPSAPSQTRQPARPEDAAAGPATRRSPETQDRERQDAPGRARSSRRRFRSRPPASGPPRPFLRPGDLPMGLARPTGREKTRSRAHRPVVLAQGSLVCYPVATMENWPLANRMSQFESGRLTSGLRACVGPWHAGDRVLVATAVDPCPGVVPAIGASHRLDVDRETWVLRPRRPALHTLR